MKALRIAEGLVGFDKGKLATLKLLGEFDCQRAEIPTQGSILGQLQIKGFDQAVEVWVGCYDVMWRCKRFDVLLMRVPANSGCRCKC